MNLLAKDWLACFQGNRVGRSKNAPIGIQYRSPGMFALGPRNQRSRIAQ